jgi:hypothetical protein
MSMVPSLFMSAKDSGPAPCGRRPERANVKLEYLDESLACESTAAGRLAVQIW